MLTFRRVAPASYRISYDGCEIGSISQRDDHVRNRRRYWHWGIDTMPLISGRTPEGRAETFEAALAAFTAGFEAWLAKVPAHQWRENVDYKRTGAERRRRKR